jgi:predicted nucleic acid-binding protein
MERFLVDTSAIFALLCKGDKNHEKAKKILKLAGEKGWQPYLTNFIVAETHALLLNRLGHEAARHWLAANKWPVERAIENDEKRAGEIISSYLDKDFSFVDAVSFAVMERLKLNKAFTFDRHFRQYGIDVIS